MLGAGRDSSSVSDAVTAVKLNLFFFLIERIKITYHIISFQFAFPSQSNHISGEVELLLTVYLIFKNYSY